MVEAEHGLLELLARQIFLVAVGFWKPKGSHAAEGTVLPAFAEVVRKLKKGE